MELSGVESSCCSLLFVWFSLMECSCSLALVLMEFSRSLALVLFCAVFSVV